MFDPNLDTRRLGELTEDLRGLAFGKLCAVEIDANLDAAIGGARECLQDWPVGQHIGRHVDFVLGAIDKCNVDVFEVFRRRIVNDRRGLGVARRERGEQDASRDARTTVSYWRVISGRHFLAF